MDLLAYECKVSSEITYLLPIPIVKRIVDIFERSLPFMNKKKALPYVSTLKKRVLERLGKITDKELKDIDTRTVRLIIFSITEISKRVSESSIN